MDTSKVMFFYPAMGSDWHEDESRTMPQPDIFYKVEREDKYLNLGFSFGLMFKTNKDYNSTVTIHDMDGNKVESPDGNESEDGFSIASHISHKGGFTVVTVKSKMRFNMVQKSGLYIATLELNEEADSENGLCAVKHDHSSVYFFIKTLSES